MFTYCVQCVGFCDCVFTCARMIRFMGTVECGLKHKQTTQSAERKSETERPRARGARAECAGQRTDRESTASARSSVPRAGSGLCPRVCCVCGAGETSGSALGTRRDTRVTREYSPDYHPWSAVAFHSQREQRCGSTPANRRSSLLWRGPPRHP